MGAVVALGEMCFEGMGAGEKGVLLAVKCVLRAWGQLKRGFQVLAMGEMCFEGMGAVKRGFEVLALGEMCRAWGQLKRGCTG